MQDFYFFYIKILIAHLNESSLEAYNSRTKEARKSYNIPFWRPWIDLSNEYLTFNILSRISESGAT